ncbi:hypothetical protein PVK06_012588 [Gossypium arboreum]|uniref:Aminotransferase-like plant mobile domain-containing protein n=1 Tax=Gossypium arboreum TaxID=29729 RepID=A0ABR0QBX1_GOSAR|nr:hypothetical protein PVK06_012588 [Gossypium arboreum]
MTRIRTKPEQNPTRCHRWGRTTDHHWSCLLERRHTPSHVVFTGDTSVACQRWDGSDGMPCQGPYRALRGRVNGLGYPSDERLMPYLELAGFGLAALIRTWGSAVLAMLYRELCRTTKPNAVDIGGCLILLQSWAFYQMQFLASVRHQAYVFPLSIVVPSHMHWIGAYEPELKLEAELEPEPEPKWSHIHSENSSYHPKLRVNDYFPGSSGLRYNSSFDIFSPVPSQYNTPPDLYPLYYSTPLGSYPP